MAMLASTRRKGNGIDVVRGGSSVANRVKSSQGKRKVASSPADRLLEIRSNEDEAGPRRDGSQERLDDFAKRARR